MAASLRAFEERLAAAVDPDRVREELVALVRTPSVTGDEERVAGLAATLLRDAGAEVAIVRDPDPAAIGADPDFPGTEAARESLPVVIGRLGRPGGRRLVLNGHLDVVPVGDTAAMAACVVDLLSDPRELARQKAAARARATDCFGVADVVDRYEDLYRRLLAR